MSLQVQFTIVVLCSHHVGFIFINVNHGETKRVLISRVISKLKESYRSNSNIKGITKYLLEVCGAMCFWATTAHGRVVPEHGSDKRNPADTVKLAA